MKKRYLPIVTLSLAIILVGSLAYAADKKKKPKVPVKEPSELSEEALKSELLTQPEEQRKKQPVKKGSSLKHPADADLVIAELQLK